MKKKQATYLSVLLSLIMVLTMLPTTIFAQSNPIGPLEQAAQAGEIEVEVVTKEEFIQENANNWGVSYAEAEQRLEPYEESMISPRVNPYQEVRMVLTSTKSLQSGYSLVCSLTAYVLQDSYTGQYFEFSDVTSAYIGIEGAVIDQSWSGDSQAWLASTTRLNVDYNGYIQFTVDSSVSIGFANFSYSSGSSTTYQYACNGQFAFYVDSIHNYT